MKQKSKIIIRNVIFAIMTLLLAIYNFANNHFILGGIWSILMFDYVADVYDTTTNLEDEE